MVSPNEKFLVLVTGINKIKEEELLSQIVVFEITDDQHQRLVPLVNFKIPKEYQNHSKTVLFNVRKDRPSDRSLLMLSNKEVVSLDFSNPKKVEMTQLYQFKFPFDDQPDFAMFCDD